MTDARPPLCRIPDGLLAPGDLAIDAGANVGLVTEQMVAAGAAVIAFEPNPVAFDALQARFAGDPRVRCVNKAVGAADTTAPLYLHEQSGEDALTYSTGSSLCIDKVNIDPSASVRVDVVDLARFVLELERDVALLKLDVEGLEVEVLERLLSAGALEHIGTVLVETHERKVPRVRGALADLRARVDAAAPGRVRWDWI